MGQLGLLIKFSFFFYNSSGTQTGVKQFVFTSGQWVQYTINLSEVGNPASISKITLQDYAGIYGSTQPAFYIDDLTFSTSTGSRLATKAKVLKTYSEVPSSKITFAPNPAENEVTVYFQELEGSTSFINITDMNGRTVHSSTTTGHSAVINVSTLKKGIYILRVNNNNTSIVEKLVVQ